MDNPQELKKDEKLWTLLLATVQFCHMLDFVVLMPLGPTLMQAFDIDPVQFASLVSSYNFAAAFSGLALGTIADRFDRKNLLLLCLVGFVAGTFACAYSPTFSLLLTARIITGIFGGTLNALVFTMVADLVPFQRRGRAMGIIMSAFSAASVFGIPLGLAISDHYGWHFTFIYIAIIGMVSIIFCFKFLPDLSNKTDPERGSRALTRLWNAFIKKEYLRGHIFIFMIAMSIFLLIPFLSPIAVNNFKIETYEIKYMYLVGGLFTIISARYVGRWTDHHGALKVLIGLALLSFIPIVIYTHSGPMSFIGYIVVGTLFMVMVSGRMIPTMTLVSHIPNEKERGSFMSVLNAIRSLGSATATLVGGLIIHEKVKGAPLTGQDHAAYLSIVMVLITLGLAYNVQRNLSGQ